MTGFGKAEANFQGKKIIVEVKALNSKSLDLSTRIAPIYREKDIQIRQTIAAKLIRGKVDFSLWTERDTTPEAIPVNTTLAEQYYKQLRTMTQNMGMPEPADWLTLLLRMPDVMSRTETEELTEEEWNVVQQVMDEALQHLIDFRKQEGAALQHKFAEKLDNIQRLLTDIEPYEKGRVEKIRARIIDGLQAIPEVDYDKNRLEQELIYYIEKLDISEEKQRLNNHLKYFRETMESEEAQGKKLGFIAQEMGREINTTGSKSNQAEMQNIVVKMKDELEQIKEQVLNAL